MFRALFAQPCSVSSAFLPDGSGQKKLQIHHFPCRWTPYPLGNRRTTCNPKLLPWWNYCWPHLLLKLRQHKIFMSPRCTS